MSTSLEVLFAPAEYALLNQRDLRQTACAVFDILRATSTMVAALGNGALEQAAYEDVLGAGALCDLIWPRYGQGAVADSVQIARRLFRLEKNDLLATIAQSHNGRRLMAHPQLCDDVPFCLQRDILSLVAELGPDGRVRISTGAPPSPTV